MEHGRCREMLLVSGTVHGISVQFPEDALTTLTLEPHRATSGYPQDRQ